MSLPPERAAAEAVRELGGLVCDECHRIISHRGGDSGVFSYQYASANGPVDVTLCIPCCMARARNGIIAIETSAFYILDHMGPIEYDDS